MGTSPEQGFRAAGWGWPTRPQPRALSSQLVRITTALAILALSLAMTAITAGPAAADARPVAVNDTLTVLANAPVSFNFCANDIPGDGASTITWFTQLPDGITRSGCQLSGSTQDCELNEMWYFVRDADGDSDYARIDLFVDCSNIDRTPDPEPEILRNFFRNQPGSFDLCANDDLGDQPTVVSYFTTLPAGLDIVDCKVVGTPTVCTQSSNFFYWLEDADGDRGYTFATIQVRCSPEPQSDSYQLTQGDFFSANVCINDYLADEPTTTLPGINLPPGLTLNNCVLAGIPSECGTFTAAYLLRDRDGDRGGAELDLEIECAILPSSSILYFDDFETNSGWNVNFGGNDEATSGIWQVANPARSSVGGVVYQLDDTPSGRKALVTGASRSNNDVDGGITSARSAAIPVPFAESVTLEFDWYFAHDSTANGSDSLKVTISGPGGVVQALDVRGAPVARPAQWRHIAVPINQYIDSNIIVTVRANDANGSGTVEAAIDNLEIRQVPVAPSLPATGIAIASAEYKLPAGAYSDVRPGVTTELWAEVTHPADLSNGPYPLVMVMHGNHSTCGRGIFPRLDDRNDYASTGSCPPGYSPVNNHAGYDWLTEPLAAAGHIVVSVNTNRGINGLAGDPGDNGLVQARGRLLLKHLETLQSWATTGGAPASLGVGANGLIGNIDFASVAYVGHSRGGEGVRAAHSQYLAGGSPWPAKIPGLEVDAIAEIAPVDRLSTQAITPTGVPWLVVLPMCDLDEPQWKGYNVLSRSLANAITTPDAPKAALAIWGADHNGFNEEWHLNDDEAFNGQCDGEQNWPINDPVGITGRQTFPARASIMSLIMAYTGDNADLIWTRTLDPLFSLPSETSNFALTERLWYDAPGTGLLVDDFSNVTGASVGGQANSQANTSVTHTYAPAYLGGPNIQTAAEIRWTATGPNVWHQSNWRPAGLGNDVSSLDVFEFRIGRPDTADRSANPNFSIQLELADGTFTNAVTLDRYASVWDMAGANFGNSEFDHPVMQTVRIPLGDFEAANLIVRGVRFTFDDADAPNNAATEILVTDLRFADGLTFTSSSAPAGSGGEGIDGPNNDRIQTGVQDDELPTAAGVYLDPIAAAAERANLVSITVRALDGFVVTAELPVLRIDGAEVSHLGEVSADQTTMTFLVDPADVSPIAASSAAVSIEVTVDGRTRAGTIDAATASSALHGQTRVVDLVG